MKRLLLIVIVAIGAIVVVSVAAHGASTKNLRAIAIRDNAPRPTLDPPDLTRRVLELRLR
jgi:hypothetical protein